MDISLFMVDEWILFSPYKGVNGVEEVDCVYYFRVGGKHAITYKLLFSFKSFYFNFFYLAV